jgi:hypothetical protein
MVALKKYPNLGIVVVVIMRELDCDGTILGYQYGIPSGYMFPTQHYIDPFVVTITHILFHFCVYVVYSTTYEHYVPVRPRAIILYKLVYFW